MDKQPNPHGYGLSAINLYTLENKSQGKTDTRKEREIKERYPYRKFGKHQDNNSEKSNFFESTVTNYTQSSSMKGSRDF